jgi:hypothetical protein
MGKYEPLGQFLKKQKADLIPMTFKEIEMIIGTKLPKSKTTRAFWSNNPDNNVMTKEWVAAGFETQDVNPQQGELVFSKKTAKSIKNSEENWQNIFGCLKGMITFPPDFDPTASPYTEEEWAEIDRERDARWDEMMRR